MRIVKLSKDVYGFDNINACLAYFEHVLPWQKYVFNIVGEGRHIGINKTKQNEVVLFSYIGEIVCMARIIDINENNGKVNQLVLKDDSVRFFRKRLTLHELESELNKHGYSKKVVQARGWNIIEENYEKVVIELLVKTDWIEYLI